MVAIVYKLVAQSVRGHLYGKAMDCIRQLRTDCQKDDDPEEYNDFM